MKTKDAKEFLKKIESKCSTLEPQHQALAVVTAQRLFYCNLAVGIINLAIASALVTHLLKEYPPLIYLTLTLTLIGAVITLITSLGKMATVPGAHLEATNQCRSLRRQLEWLELESQGISDQDGSSRVRVMGNS